MVAAASVCVVVLAVVLIMFLRAATQAIAVPTPPFECLRRFPETVFFIVSQMYHIMLVELK